MLNRVQAWIEAIRGSLFYTPVVYLAVAVALSLATLSIDQRIGSTTEDIARLPSSLRATVESARALLGTVATATITFAGVAFSIALLMFQLSASQFSPRVLHGFFRERISKRVMGIAVGTFAYALMVLRTVRSPVESDGDAVIPTVSVLLALLLGIVSVLAILGFINHIAHSMQVGEIIRRIADDTSSCIEALARLSSSAQPAQDPPLPDREPWVVTAAHAGWIQQVDPSALLHAVDRGCVMRLEAAIGGFVVAGGPLCSVWPAPEEPDRVERRVRAAVTVGRNRTMQQDIGYGIRQIVDIALRALSTGVNDPTTAQECLEHLGQVVRDVTLRPLPPKVLRDERECVLLRPHETTHEDLVTLAFDQIRRAAVDHPAVGMTMINVLGTIARDVRATDHPERVELLEHQAASLLREMDERGGHWDEMTRIRRRAEQLGLVGSATGRAGAHP